MKHLPILRGLIASALFFFSAYSTIACSCAVWSTCQAYGAAKAVFVGKVIEGRAAERMSDMVKAGTKDLTFKFSVSRAFLGVKKGDTVVVHTGFGFGDCGFPFEKGEEYVVYAHDNKGTLQTGICSRTRHISDSADEVKDLDALLLTNGGMVNGMLTRYEQSSLIGPPFKPLARRIVRLVRVGNAKVYRSVTDEKGGYQFNDLPTGRYRLKIDLEPGWVLDDYETQEFLLNKHGCAKEDLSVENNSHVNGLILDPDGKPVKNVWVEFIPVGVSSTTNRFPKEFSTTNPQGEIGWFSLPPGKYTASINFLNAPDDEAPFPASFAPGVLDRTNARIIEIKPGSDVNDIVIRIPARLAERNISGSVFWPDGTPAENASVFLLDMVTEDAYVGESVDTNSEGRFQKTGYAGRRYIIHVRADKKVGDRDVVYRAETAVFPSDGQINAFRLVLQPEAE